MFSGYKELTLDDYIEIVNKLSRVDKDMVEDELVSFPATYSYYYGMMVRSKKDLDASSVKLEQFKAAIRMDARSSKTKLTVAAGDDIINTNEDIKDLNNEILNKEEIYGFYKGICNTLEHKKDMLVQISANRRQEIKLHQ